MNCSRIIVRVENMKLNKSFYTVPNAVFIIIIGSYKPGQCFTKEYATFDQIIECLLITN